jgi:hypothetical protein
VARRLLVAELVDVGAGGEGLLVPRDDDRLERRVVAQLLRDLREPFERRLRERVHLPAVQRDERDAVLVAFGDHEVVSHARRG